MTDRENLAARIEAAGGPDAELYKAIAQMIGMCLHPNTTRNGAQSDWGYDCDDCGANSWGAKSKDGFNRRLSDRVPAFMESLDAAIMLAGEEMDQTALTGLIVSAAEECYSQCADIRKDLARYIAAAAIRAGGV